MTGVRGSMAQISHCIRICGRGYHFHIRYCSSQWMHNRYGFRHGIRHGSGNSRIRSRCNHYPQAQQKRTRSRIMMIHHMLSPSKRLQRQLIRNLQKFGCWVFGVCRSFAGVLSLAPLTLYAAAAKRSQKFFYHKSCIKKDKSLHTVTADTIIRNTVKRSNRLWQSLQTKNSVPSKISFI